MNLIEPAASGSEALVLRSTRSFQPFGAWASSGVTASAASAAMRTRRVDMTVSLMDGQRPVRAGLSYVRTARRSTRSNSVLLDQAGGAIVGVAGRLAHRRAPADGG